MDSLQLIREIVILIPVILLALTIHEVAHGWVAERQGDDTARLAGRITLNPLRHLDPIGVLFMFIFHFGWAKPVPVDPGKLRDPRKGMIIVSLAGPLSNIIVGIIFGIILRFYLPYFFTEMLSPEGASGISKGVLLILILGLEINLFLAIFNLIPIPPLDGSNILFNLLPLNVAYKYRKFFKQGMFILFFLIFLQWVTHIPIFYYIIKYPANLLTNIFTGHPLFSLLRLFNSII